MGRGLSFAKIVSHFEACSEPESLRIRHCALIVSFRGLKNVAFSNKKIIDWLFPVSDILFVIVRWEQNQESILSVPAELCFGWEWVLLDEDEDGLIGRQGQWNAGTNAGPWYEWPLEGESLLALRGTVGNWRDIPRGRRYVGMYVGMWVIGGSKPYILCMSNASFGARNDDVYQIIESGGSTNFENKKIGTRQVVKKEKKSNISKNRAFYEWGCSNMNTSCDTLVLLVKHEQSRNLLGRDILPFLVLTFPFCWAVWSWLTNLLIWPMISPGSILEF